MKKILMFSLLSFNLCVNAYLLVVQKNNQNLFRPLSDENIQKYNDAILNVLVRYTWPSCIAYDLSDNEKSELLAPQPGAEQNFVRKKLQKIDKNLDVIFVPTALYELFYINVYLYKIEDKCEQASLSDQKPYLTDPEYIDNYVTSDLEAIEDILNEDESTVREAIKKSGKKLSPAEYVKQEIHELSQDCNEKLFDKEDSFGYPNVLKVHQEFFDNLSMNKNFQKITEIEELIRTDSKNIKNVLIKNLIRMQQNVSNDAEIKKNFPIFYNWMTNPSGDSDENDLYPSYSSRYGLPQIIEFLAEEENNHIIQKTIEIEYQAAKSNKGLLFRGSDVIKANRDLNIIGTTQRMDATLESQGLFSMSFGISLFAGFFFYIDAMAYAYLTELGGYALFVNKFEYVDNYNSNLFLIPGLTIEMALFGQRVWFHPRSKPVTLDKSKHDKPIIGIVTNDLDDEVIKDPYDEVIKDPYGIFLVTRDPYRQAFLFSKYLVENATFIGNLNTQSLLEDEKIALAVLKDQQKHTGMNAMELLVKKYKQRKKQKIKSLIKLVDVLKVIKNASTVKKYEPERSWITKNNQKENAKKLSRVVDVLKVLQNQNETDLNKYF